MPSEVWRPVPAWPGYQVSGRGRVRSVDRVLADGRGAGGKLLKPSKDKDGYRYVTLANGPERWRVHVGRLVLLAFAGEPESPELEACHRNGRRWDNRAANLYWGTDGENRADRERHRREREARAAVSGVTAGNEVTAGTTETGRAAPCPLDLVSASSQSRR